MLRGSMSMTQPVVAVQGYTPICQVLIRQVQNGQVKLANSPNLPSDKPPSTDLPTGKLAKNEKSPGK